MKTNVDCVIISYAKNEFLKSVTQTGIYSLLQSEPNSDITFNIFVVESNKNVSYAGCAMIYPEIPFNYNAYLNLGARQGKSEYVALLNNDLTFEKNWASEIIAKMKSRSEILSASPFCPQTQDRSLQNISIVKGYKIRQQINGWAIFQQRKIYDIIGKLSEDVEFWYSDDIYAQQLIKHNICHALCTNSIVNHHEKNLGISGQEILTESEKTKMTVGQYELYKKAIETL